MVVWSDSIDIYPGYGWEWRFKNGESGNDLQGGGEDPIFTLPFSPSHDSHVKRQNGTTYNWARTLGPFAILFLPFPRVPLNRSIFLARTPFLVLLSTRSFKRDPPPPPHRLDAFPIFHGGHGTAGWNNLGNVESDRIIWRLETPIWRVQSPFTIAFQIGSLERALRRMRRWIFLSEVCLSNTPILPPTQLSLESSIDEPSSFFPSPIPKYKDSISLSSIHRSKGKGGEKGDVFRTRGINSPEKDDFYDAGEESFNDPVKLPHDRTFVLRATIKGVENRRKKKGLGGREGKQVRGREYISDGNGCGSCRERCWRCVK